MAKYLTRRVRQRLVEAEQLDEDQICGRHRVIPKGSWFITYPSGRLDLLTDEEFRREFEVVADGESLQPGMAVASDAAGCARPCKDGEQPAGTVLAFEETRASPDDAE